MDFIGIRTKEMNKAEDNHYKMWPDKIQLRRFLSRNAEHLVAGVHLWCWIYYDFASFFQQKYPRVNPSAIFNSTSHGIVRNMNFRLIQTLFHFVSNTICFKSFQLLRSVLPGYGYSDLVVEFWITNLHGTIHSLCLHSHSLFTLLYP